MTEDQPPTDTQFFLQFLKNKIDLGEPQTAIAKSEHVNLSVTYVNRLYRNPPKSVSTETQANIAKHFKLSLERVLEEGKILYYERNNRRTLRRESNNVEGGALDKTPEVQIELLDRLLEGVRANHRELAICAKSSEQAQYQEKFITTLISIISLVDQGITFFDTSEKYVFSNFKSGFLDNINTTSNDTIETILLSNSEHIENFQEVVKTIQEYKKDKTKDYEMAVFFKDERIIYSKIKSVLDKNNEYLGTLIISKPQNHPPPPPHTQ